MLRLFRNVDTIIPCLLSTYEFYDRIAVVNHDGSNDDGSVDAVRYANMFTRRFWLSFF